MKSSLSPWYWRSLPLEDRAGSAVFAALFLQQPADPNSPAAIATLLESPYPPSLDYPELTRYSICAGPPRCIEGEWQLWTPAIGEGLSLLDWLLQRPQADNATAPADLPFTGGWLGWLGYDFAWEIERLPWLKSDALPFPTAFWYEPDCFAVLDHHTQMLWLAASTPEKLDELQHRLTNAAPIAPYSALHTPHAAGSQPRFHLSQKEYESIVHKAKKYIEVGDIFQANLSLRFQTEMSTDSWAIYRTLHQINPSPFASYWRTLWGDVVSCSPERLVQGVKNTTGQYHASTRPIAGTRYRGITPFQDQMLAQELLSNHKEKAEHIMLVDLERNDLGRVCQWGTVQVNELLAIERYSHVMHLASNVRGSLRSDRTPIDLIRALFPGGTITGCPKVRCMEIIEELEPVRRSLFYGSCGYLDQQGNLDLNILIRTLLLTGSTVYGQVGAGIVADSCPEREWYECLHKAEAQLTALKAHA